MPCGMLNLPVGSRVPLCALALLGLAISGLAGCGAEDAPRPNLVLITVDRLAADRLACFGGDPEAGRSICALGEGGTLFAWAAALGRGEASGAASVLTGLRESDHGVGPDGRTFLVDAQDSVAEDLSRAGYATAAFVTRPRVNRSRRLDQGFDHYDDSLASSGGPNHRDSIDLSERVHDWTESAEAPWFVWIHADRDEGVAELDRLISRLSQTLDDRSDGPGILFVALAGESPKGTSSNARARPRIGWDTHRVPLLWRPPSGRGAPPNAVSRELVSLLDVRPTLRAAAKLPPESDAAEAATAGRNLDAIGRRTSAAPEPEDRYVLLEVVDPIPDRDVGLATRDHLYARRTSPIDGGGNSVPTSQLQPLGARFASIPPLEPGSARLAPGPWRTDVLSSQSPVPRLEFHLARLLARPASKELE